jgi:hypothetical protein
MNEVTGDIVPQTLTGEDMLTYFSDADFNEQPLDQEKTSANVDKALSAYIKSKPNLNDPLSKPTGIEFNWIQMKKNAPPARKIIAVASQLSRSIFIKKTVCARPTLTKELGRFLTNELSKIDVDAQVSTLNSHGFFSPANQIRISHHNITKIATSRPTESSELDRPTQVYTEDVFQDYIKHPFSTKNQKAIRKLLAARYEKLDEHGSVSSDDDDDDHHNASDSEVESTIVSPPFIAPWLTSKEMPMLTKLEG